MLMCGETMFKLQNKLSVFILVWIPEKVTSSSEKDASLPTAICWLCLLRLGTMQRINWIQLGRSQLTSCDGWEEARLVKRRSGSLPSPSLHSLYYLKVSSVMKSKLIMPALNSARSFRAPWPSSALLFCLTFVWDLNLTLGQLQPLTTSRKGNTLNITLKRQWRDGGCFSWGDIYSHFTSHSPRSQLRLFNWGRMRTDVIFSTLHNELHQGPLFL